MRITWFDKAFCPYISTLGCAMPRKVAVALTLMVSLSLMEGIGLLMLVPLLGLAGLDVSQGDLGGVARFTSSAFRFAGIHPTLITVLVVYVLIVSAYGLLQRWQAAVNADIQYGFVAVLRQRLYRSIANTNWVFFTRSRSSEFTHVLTGEMDRVGAATHYLLRLFATAIVTLVYMGFALRLSVSMTGVVIVCSAGLWLLLRGRVKVARTAGEGVSQTRHEMHGVIAEYFGGMKVARSFGAQDRYVDAFERLTLRMEQMYLTAIRNQAALKHWFDISAVILLSVTLFVSVEALAMPTVNVLLLLFLYARLMPRFSEMLQSYHSFVNAVPAFTSVIETQRRCESAAEASPGRVQLLAFRHSIRLEDVSFGYGATEVIRGLDLTIRAGEMVAIVGPSGAGKSTVADLLMGLIVPDRGRVLVDGVQLTPTNLRSWRDGVGYFNQDTFLFHDTVRANLLFARPDAAEEDIRQALKAAAADEFVSRLPKGIDTIVGDRGMQLSGGERQRLALARALIRKPSLLVLDEATSSLDLANERHVLKTLDRLRGRVTILIISHRLSAVQGADAVYVLQDGKAVEAETCRRKQSPISYFCG